MTIYQHQINKSFSELRCGDAGQQLDVSELVGDLPPRQATNPTRRLPDSVLEKLRA